MTPLSPSPGRFHFVAALRIAAVLSFAMGAGCGRSSLFGFDPGEGDGCIGPNCTSNNPDFAGRDLWGIDFAGQDLTPNPPPPDLSIPDGGSGDSGPIFSDGFTADLADASIPCNQRIEICNNGTDDNCNGLIDCADPECMGDVNCQVKGKEICNNGIDDDHNGLTDCKDPACATFPGCMTMVCDPNNPDCANPACVNDPHCKNLVCMPTVDFGTLQPHDSKSEQMINTVGTTDVTMTPCAPGGGGMVVTEFVVAQNQTPVRLDFQQSNGGDHVFALFLAGVGQKCNANPLGCYDPKSALTGHNIWTLDAGHYYLMVQAFTKQHQGQLDVTLSTPPTTMKMEICNNGIDDDMNGLTDCQDPACFNSMFCANKECKPDQNVGTLVIGDPGKMASFATNKNVSKYTLDCGGKGGDYAVEFSLAETAGVGMDFSQTGDHLIGLFQKPPAGQNCDAQQIDCADPGKIQQLSYAWDAHPAGDYIFIFKANQPGTEGHIDVTLYAYGLRKVELCHNGIDDDGNGLIDCQDPACFADPGCGAPVCMPDYDLGTLQPGQEMTTQLDTNTGILNLSASCAGTGGKAKVIQLNLAQPGGITFQCNEQSGQAVLGLFSEAGPRDSCDKHEVSCADPAVLPFKCNFIIPNLQAGIYYVMVEAFQKGDEGKMTITLGAETERTLEICNNKIDDDMDGFTDCADRKCATSPYCTAQACKAETGIDPMPLDGSPSIVTVNTVMKQVTAQPPCEVTPGGGDSVIFLNLPADANVKADWSQAFSNHVFAIYPELAPGLICEAAKPLGCFPSAGANTGTVTFPRLTLGKYWVVVAADKPGDEGTVTLRFTATP